MERLTRVSPAPPPHVTVFALDPQLVGVDVVAALDLYVEQGHWDKCIETATKQVLLSPSPSQLCRTCSLDSPPAPELFSVLLPPKPKDS